MLHVDSKKRITDLKAKIPLKPNNKDDYEKYTDASRTMPKQTNTTHL